MPYLDGNWLEIRPNGRTIERAQAGLWVPERDWEGWEHRGHDLTLRNMWRKEGIEPRTQLDQLRSLSAEESAKYLSVLGTDLGSIQRDNFFYTNFAEKLKQSPDDATAETVVKTMEKLSFTSTTMPSTVGGPPPHQSFRPWERVLRWLISNMGKVGKIILKIADFIAGILSRGGLGASAVTVSAGLPSPEIGIEWSAELFNSNFWAPLRQFLENVQTEFAAGLR